jgi:hypothetical protein
MVQTVPRGRERTALLVLLGVALLLALAALLGTGAGPAGASSPCTNHAHHPVSCVVLGSARTDCSGFNNRYDLSSSSALHGAAMGTWNRYSGYTSGGWVAAACYGNASIYWILSTNGWTSRAGSVILS